MSLDRIKSAVVSSIAAALTGQAIRSAKIQEKASAVINPVSPSTLNNICDSLSASVINSSLVPAQKDILLQEISGCRPAVSDSHLRADLKLRQLGFTKRTIDMSTKRNAATGKQRYIADAIRAREEMKLAVMPKDYLSGKGDYTWKQIANDALGGVGYAGGGTLGALIGTRGNPLNVGGGYYGAAVGSSVGSTAMRELGRLVGMGDYAVKMNTLAKNSFALQPGQPVPQFGGKFSRATRITHREYVQDLVVPAVPTSFTNVTYSINPGNTTLFPWLSNVAAQYQQYEIHGMVVEFRTLSSDITGGGALGSVIIATNYDVLEPAFVNKTIMENAQFSVSTKPSCGLLHTIECDPSQRPTKLLYVRDSSSSATSSQDARFMDLGLLQIATTGLPGTAGTVIGELWISYDISLYKPEITGNVQGFQNISSFGGSSVSGPLGTSNTNTGSRFFTITSPTILNSLVSGPFFVEFTGTGTGLASVAFTPSSGSTVVFLETATTSATVISTFLLTPSSAGATFTITVTGTTLTTQALRIFKFS